MKIGENIDLGVQPLLLAPMEDVTDPSFRWVCKEFGADMMYTEFISSDRLVRDARKSLEKLKTYDFEAPIGIQIYGSIPEAMVDAAVMADRATELVEMHGADEGCLREVFKVYQMDYPEYEFYDTLSASRKHFGCGLPNHQLQTVAAACGYDLTRHHHALADAEACAHIAIKLL